MFFLRRSYHHKQESIFKKKHVIRNWSIRFHKLSAVSLKTQILKAPPKGTFCGDYKTFDKNSFNNELKSKLDSI